MEKILLVVCLMLSFNQANAEGYLSFQTGNTLLDYCSDSEGRTSDLCYGYIEGIIDIHTLFAYKNILNPGWCDPSGAPISQHVRVVTKYLQDNPRNLSNPASILVFTALTKAYPCER